jgi:hypothetical protein
MIYDPLLSRAFNWPSPYSLSARVLGWLSYWATAMLSALCLVLAWAVLAVGVVALVCLLAVAVPVVATLAAGWCLLIIAGKLAEAC